MSIYSTGNSIQYSVMAYMGKESKKEWLDMYMYYTSDSLCFIPETNTTVQLYSNKNKKKKNRNMQTVFSSSKLVRE